MITFWSVLFLCCWIGVLTHELDASYDLRTSRALLQIFGQCKEGHDTILIDNDCEQHSSQLIQQLNNQYHSIFLRNNELRYRQKIRNFHKVHDILILLTFFNSSSSEEPEKTYRLLYKVLWEKTMTPVYLLQFAENDCDNAMNILQLVWKIRIMTSYFLCTENDEIYIYTYNPFTNRAPSEWTEVGRLPSESRWTLYQRKYDPKSVCSGLHFDRTKHLDGYPIYAADPIVRNQNCPLLGKCINVNNLLRYGSRTQINHYFNVRALTIMLNVSIRSSFSSASKLQRVYDLKKLKADLVLLDFVLPDELYIENKSYTVTYPVVTSEYGIATYNRGYKTLTEKLMDFYGFWTILFTIFVLVITFVVIWCFENRGTAFALFEIIRLSITNGLYTRMNTLPLRIFFITVLIYFLIIQATFSGHLAKFLTKPEFRRHPETNEDLRDLGYQVYDLKYFESHLNKPEKLITNYMDLIKLCLNQISHNNTLGACILGYYELLSYVQMKNIQNLYIPKTSFGTLYTTSYIKYPWPLSDRVNTILMSLEELGFRQKMADHWKYTLMHNATVIEARSTNKFHPIEVENLIFAFSILEAGLISSALSFSVELFMRHKFSYN